MFKVYRLNDEGLAVLLATRSDEDAACDAVDKYSNKYPNAVVDYVFKDEWELIKQVSTC